MDEGLGKRLFDFAVRFIKFCRTFPRGKEYEIIKYQLVKSATSSGSNYSPRQIKFYNIINALKLKYCYSI